MNRLVLCVCIRAYRLVVEPLNETSVHPSVPSILSALHPRSITVRYAQMMSGERDIDTYAGDDIQLLLARRLIS